MLHTESEAYKTTTTMEDNIPEENNDEIATNYVLPEKICIRRMSSNKRD